MKFRQLFEKAIKIDKELNKIKTIFKSFESKVNKNNIKEIIKLLNKKLSRHWITIHIYYTWNINFYTNVDELLNATYDVITGDIEIALPGNFYELIEKDHIKLFKIILNAIEHELIHKEQRTRSKAYPVVIAHTTKKSELAHPDEIMAYAKSAINTLKGSYTKEEILKAMRLFKGYKYRHSPLYDSLIVQKYFEYFYDDKGQKVWKKFIKYMYQYLED